MADPQYPNLFDASNPECEVPHVDRVDFNFIVNDECEILALPGPIYECPLPEILPEPDTEVGIKCPIFSDVTGDISVGYVGRSGDGQPCVISDIPEIALNIERTGRDPCDYSMSLYVNVPLPEPSPLTILNEGDVNVNIAFSDCLTSGGAFAITRTVTPGDCQTPDTQEYDLNLNLDIGVPRPPCPTINVGRFGVTTSYDQPDCELKENRFEIRQEESGVDDDCETPPTCDFIVDLELFIPLPVPPCPEFIVRNVLTRSQYFDNPNDCPIENRFEITPQPVPATCNDPPKCNFIVDLDLTIPIPRPACPSFRMGRDGDDGGRVTVKNNFCAEPFFYFDIIPRPREETCDNDEGCVFDVFFDLSLPVPRVPCPTIYVDDDAFNVNVVYDRSQCPNDYPPNGFRIITEHVPGDCETPDTCQFRVELDLLIPIPTTCVVLNQNSDEDFVKVGYADCDLVRDKRSIFRITQKEFEEEDCGAPPQCEWDIELDIYVPIPRPPCVVLTNNTTDDFVKVGYENCPIFSGRESKFSIKKKQVPTNKSCDEVADCEWEFDVEILVPIPRPPCVTITNKSDDPVVKVGYPDCPTIVDPETGKPKKSFFTITQVEHEEVTDCGTTTRCEWEIDLEIVVPIPRVPCPEIQFAPESFITARYDDSMVPFEAALGNFSIEKRETRPETCSLTNPNVCEFDIWLEIDIPVPRIPCVTINTRSKRLTVQVSEEPSEMRFEIEQCHKENIGTNKPPECCFNIDLEIDINIPLVCPVIRQGTTIIRRVNPEILLYRDPRFKMTARTDCIPGVKIFIYIDFDIEIPFCVYRFEYDNIGNRSRGPAQGDAIKKLYYNPALAEAPVEDAKQDMLKVHVAQDQQDKCKYWFSAEARLNLPSVYYEFPPVQIGPTGPTCCVDEADIETSGAASTGCMQRSSGRFRPITRMWFEDITGPGNTEENNSGQTDPIKVVKQLRVDANNLRGGEVTIRPLGIGCGYFTIDDCKINLDIDLNTADCFSSAGVGGASQTQDGPHGATGPTGPRGSAGRRGDTGATGLQGATGPRPTTTTISVVTDVQLIGGQLQVTRETITILAAQ